MLYYDTAKSEIKYYTPISGRLVIDSSGTYSIPSGVQRAWISAVGGGGGGGAGDEISVIGGGGGGSGGMIYKYPINIYLNQFIIIIGKGGIGGNGGTGGNGGETKISYYLENLSIGTITLGGGGGGSYHNGFGGVRGGAGGSVTFENDTVTANYSSAVLANSSTPFSSFAGTSNNGQSGTLIFPIVIGSSGGGVTLLSTFGGSGGNNTIGFKTGGTGGIALFLSDGGGGGGASFFSNGGKGSDATIGPNPGIGNYGSGFGSVMLRSVRTTAL